LGRLGRVVCFAIILAVAAPASGATTQRTIRCSGSVRSGGTGSCHASIVIPHFNARDSIDYSSLIARVESPSASGWTVSGSIADARGVVYFAWQCSARRSSVTRGGETYVGRSCTASRKTVTVRRNGRTYTSYYVADTSKPQRLRVSAQVSNCTPTGIRGCRYQGKATYLIAG
jgi:hypothetical protein